MEKRDEKTVVIVDFDNFFPKNMNDYSIEEVGAFFSNVVGLILQQRPKVSFMNFRLYGGWFKGGSFTQKASALSSMLAYVDVFPIIIEDEKIDGTIDMVYSQYGLDDFVWYDTFREKAGLQKFRIDRSKMGIHCASNESVCAVKILDKFVRKQKMCQNIGCTTIQQEVFVHREQKMIDTMMACDVIAFSDEKDISAMYIVSDDIDIFPSIALCKKRDPETELTLIIKNNLSQPQYSSILSNFDTKVVLL